MSGLSHRRRLLIFVVAFNAEKTITRVLQRIPQELCKNHETEVLIIDDSSRDQTVERCYAARQMDEFPFKVSILVNPRNHGYGGNQKIGFQFALTYNYDYVALVHGDGQYAPECLPLLLEPLISGQAEAVLGSRMMTTFGALKGGMPFYKFIGNIVLTKIQNWILGMDLSEFHSGYRIYSVAALRKIPFRLNTNDFHFDTEIIVQMSLAQLRIAELPIPTYYGTEICHVQGLKYAWNVLKATMQASLQTLGVFYDPKYDCLPAEESNRHYLPKLQFESPHTFALRWVDPGSKVLDIGCASGYLCAALKASGCVVQAIDRYVPGTHAGYDKFYEWDLNCGSFPIDVADFDYVLCLDVIEHLFDPERFVDCLLEAIRHSDSIEIIVSTGNIGFVIPRLMLLFGQFNYGKRGILDLTHTRLFTFSSFRRLFEQRGFEVIDCAGVPAPFPFAVGDSWLGKSLGWLNRVLIRISRKLFAYQIVMVVRPRRALERLVQDAELEGQARERLFARHSS